MRTDIPLDHKVDAIILGRTNRRPSSGIISIIAALVILIGTYPSSPQLFLFFLYENKISFLLYSIFLIALSYLFWPRTRIDVGTWSKELRFLLLCLGAFLTIKFAVHHTEMLVIRDFAVLICVVVLMRSGESVVRRVMGRATSIIAILIVISLLAVIFFNYLGAVDLSDWNVDKLNGLSAGNPIVKRNILEKDYYLPFYLAVIPLFADTEIAFGIQFIRQPLIFTEWSFTWYFLAPIVLVAIGYRRSVLCVAALSVMLIALCISFSVWGVLVLAFALFLLKFGRFIRSPSMLGVLILATIGIILYFFKMEGVLALIGGNKLEQYEIFSKVTTGLITPFGDLAYFMNNKSRQAYGVLHLLYIYGVVGMGLYVILMLFGLWASFTVVSRSRKFRKDTLWAAGAVIFVILAGLKLSYFISFFQVLFTGYLCMLMDRDEKDRGSLKNVPYRQPELWPL